MNYFIDCEANNTNRDRDGDCVPYLHEIDAADLLMAIREAERMTIRKYNAEWGSNPTNINLISLNGSFPDRELDLYEAIELVQAGRIVCPSTPDISFEEYQSLAPADSPVLKILGRFWGEA